VRQRQYGRQHLRKDEIKFGFRRSLSGTANKLPALFPVWLILTVAFDSQLLTMHARRQQPESTRGPNGPLAI
jgi:hypothetical protein